MTLKEMGTKKQKKKHKCKYCKENFIVDNATVEKIGKKSLYSCPYCQNEWTE